MTDVDGLRAQIEDWLWQREALNSGFIEEQRSAWAAGARPDLDDLIPVVTAWAEQQARQRAAEELRAAAADVTAGVVSDPAAYLNARADMNASFAALADDGQP